MSQTKDGRQLTFDDIGSGGKYDVELLDNHEEVVERRRDLVYEDGTVDCPQCGDNYEDLGIGSHWVQSSCDYPQFTQKQYEIVIGSLMGDGSVRRKNKNPYSNLYNTNTVYLDYVRQQFPLLMTDVKLKSTAEEGVEYTRKRNLDYNVSPTEYHDCYRVRTRGTPDLAELADWYSSGEKVFDQDLELTPTITRHWYAGDGNLDMSHVLRDNGFNSKGNCEITATNERERSHNITKMFQEAGFDVSFHCDKIRFTVEETKRFLDWIGPAPPGFSYKWEVQDPDRYKHLKKRAYGDL